MREGIRLPTGSGILRARNNLEIRSYVVAIVSDNQRLHKLVRLTCHAKQHDERTHTLYFFDWRIESKEPIDPYPILRYKNYHRRWDRHRAVVCRHFRAHIVVQFKNKISLFFQMPISRSAYLMF